jgi:hypothetical protein
MRKILILTLLIGLMACSSDDKPNSDLNLSFEIKWDNASVTSANLNSTVYTTAIGQDIRIERLRFLISRLTLKNESGVSFPIGEYFLVDLSNPNSMNFSDIASIVPGNYTLSFIYGFNEADNVSGAYASLNATSWNWPDMLGGGYHFLQMDGVYHALLAQPLPFNFHHGTARVSTNQFEQNFVSFDFPETLTIQNNSTLHIRMNVAEWFKNPNLWDLEIYNTNLMMNYQAQIMMNQNAQSVFSIHVH